MRTEYKANNIGGLTTGAGMAEPHGPPPDTGAGMAEPHGPPPEAQAVPGSILDEAPFLSIVDFQRFAVRLSKVGTQMHQARATLQHRDH